MLADATAYVELTSMRGWDVDLRAIHLDHQRRDVGKLVLVVGDALVAVQRACHPQLAGACLKAGFGTLAMQRLGDKLKLIGASAQVRRQSLVAWALSTKRVLVCFDAIGAKLVEELALDRWYFHAGLAIASSKRRPNSLLKPHVNLVVVSQQLSESAGQPCTVVGRLS